jgi:formyltetrahydrofolate deformylase
MGIAAGRVRTRDGAPDSGVDVGESGGDAGPGEAGFVSTRNIVATLLVSCPDRKGLVAALSQLLYDHGANILQAQQHTDPIDKLFFQRIRFDMTELDISRKALEDLLEIECGRYQMRWCISYSNRPKRVAIFVSKFEHCLYDLLLRHRLGEFACEIVMVISNHPDLEPVAKQFGIPYHVFSISSETKAEQESKEIALLKQEEIDLVILARYMQVLGEEFVSRFPDHIINIHHSFLPAFSGARPYHQAYARGVKLIGATAHYATWELDEGPIIAQEVVACSHRDTMKDLVRKGRDVERIALASAVRSHLEDRVVVHGRRTIVF